MSSAARAARPLRLSAALAAPLLALTACGGATSPGAPSAGSAAAAGPTSPADPVDGDAGGNEREVATVQPRLLMSHAGGLTLLDAATGKVLKETAHEAFLRLHPAGDGRHVMVSDSDVFRVYDTGISSQPHGDHKHHHEYTPGLTATTFDAPHAGHVVVHGGRTALFSDGTGAITTFESDDVADSGRKDTAYRTDAPHHGVAFELADGSLFTTQGTEKSRNTVQVKKGGKVVAETKDCPGSHGESTAKPTAKGEVVVMGCENGPVVFRDGAFHKVPVKEKYARSGNLVGSPTSPVVLADYKVDKEAKPVERPTRVALIDTVKDTLRLVDLRSPYWFRSFGRGPAGEGLALTYDGRLHVLDVAAGKTLAALPVVAPWQEKDDWQEPGPAVKVAGERAYVTDAEKKMVTVVDIPGRKVTGRYALPHTPVEIAVTTGEAEAPAEHNDHEGHDDHDHGAHTPGHTH